MANAVLRFLATLSLFSFPFYIETEFLKLIFHFFQFWIQEYKRILQNHLKNLNFFTVTCIEYDTSQQVSYSATHHILLRLVEVHELDTIH